MLPLLRDRSQDCTFRFFLTPILLSALAASGFGAEPDPEWPLIPLKRPTLPTFRSNGWVRNPLDVFVQAGLEKAGLQPNPPADKRTLLRRVTFDLIGLLPTAAECNAFLADSSPDAYEKVVDRLLASPRFGERWAQHWLDVVRFAETEGFKLDRLRPDAWRYRDYVIRACNQDLPYDRFISQQLAGDELEPDEPDARIATGFYRLLPEETNGSNYRQVRQDMLDDVTDVFSTTFLGLTLGCARCHDHKFDPLTQRDYFRLQAFFTPLMQRDDLPIASAEEQAEHKKQMAKWEEATRAWRAQRDNLLAGPNKAIREEVSVTFDAETQQALRTADRKRTPLQRQLAALSGTQLARRLSRSYRRLNKEQRALYDDLEKRINASKPKPLPTAMGVVCLPGAPPPTHRLATGNYLRPRERVLPGFPECLDSASTKGLPPGGESRAALVRWLCRPDHPLTSRVIVNRLWQHYLGVGIVSTPNDFGVMGDKPTHPELLDYLATELIQQGWKLKAVHRAIVLSATYRQASAPRFNRTVEKAVQVDPGDKLLWHARIKRREAEAIRDAVLQASGQLNARMSGPSNCPELPAAILESTYAWDPDPQASNRDRRSIYLLAKRNFAYPLFAAFDQPDRVNSCPVRPATITAPQALAMLNSEFTLNQARCLAVVLLSDFGRDPSQLIEDAYLRTFGRGPEPHESAAALKFLQQQSRLVGSNGGSFRQASSRSRMSVLDPASVAAVIDFCHALLNSAEFLDVE